MQPQFADSFESGSDEQQQQRYDIGVVAAAGGPAISETQLGSRRTVGNIAAKEWVFLAATGIGILASCAFAVYFLATSIGDPDTNADFTLALLLLLNGCFTGYYLLDGIFTERAYELLVLVGTVVLVTVYLVANFFYMQGWHSPVKIARLATAALLGPVSVVLGGFIIYEYLSSGNFIFRKVGADAALQRLCQRLFLTESAIKFDLQSTLSVVLLVVKVNGTELAEQLILGLGISLSLAWNSLAVIALRLENYTLTILLLITGLIQPAYMTYTVVVNVDHLVNSNETVIPKNADFSNSMHGVSIITSVFALGLRFGLLAMMALAVRSSFGRGLRRKLVPPILRRLTNTTSEYGSI